MVFSTSFLWLDIKMYRVFFLFLRSNVFIVLKRMVNIWNYVLQFVVKENKNNSSKKIYNKENKTIHFLYNFILLQNSVFQNIPVYIYHVLQISIIVILLSPERYFGREWSYNVRKATYKWTFKICLKLMTEISINFV